VPQDVIARCDILGEPEQPAVVIFRYRIPAPEVRSLIYEPNLVDLKEFQFGFVNVFLEREFSILSPAD